jgi:hypothetical protein
MSRVVTLDLDAPDADDLARLWAELEWRRASRNADPELFDAICQRLADLEESGDMARLDADAIRAELRQSHPAAVLNAHWRQLLPDRPALGAFMKEQVLADAA